MARREYDAVTLLSIANSTRLDLEANLDSRAEDYEQSRKMYIECITVCADTQALNLVTEIESRNNSYSVLVAGFTDQPTDPIVSEALSGLAMIALHRGMYSSLVSFAYGALRKHKDALHLVNSIRIMAMAKPESLSLAWHITEMTIIPFLLIRRYDADTMYERILQREIDLWCSKEEDRDKVMDFSQQLLDLSIATVASHNGGSCLVTAHYRNGILRAKKCAICGNSETTSLKKCVKCRLVYYCSKACQLADWAEHKKTCTKRAEVEVSGGSL